MHIGTMPQLKEHANVVVEMRLTINFIHDIGSNCFYMPYEENMQHVMRRKLYLT